LKRKPLTPANSALIVKNLDTAISIQRDDPITTVYDQVQKAEALRELEQYDDMLKTCDQALAVSPNDREAHFWKVDALLGLRRFGDVAAACQTALARGLRDASLYQACGLALAALKDYPGAIEKYTSALTLEPERRSLHLLRGWAYLAAKSPRMARPDFEKSLDLEATAIEGHCGLGNVCAALGDYQEAVEHARMVLKLDPNPTPFTLYMVAKIHAQAADLVKSIDVARRHLDDAQTYLVEASAKTAAPERAGFWQVVSRDPDLRAIHRRRTYPGWYRQNAEIERMPVPANGRAGDSWLDHLRFPEDRGFRTRPPRSSELSPEPKKQDASEPTPKWPGSSP
jgi:tetratricopeptide (TPR) repeat protein